MIDFVSTRTTVDHQTQACARLLAAVISQAVQDAAIPFGNFNIKGRIFDENKLKKNINSTARAAIQWLFFPGSTFPAYASLIGLNAKSIREHLLEHRYEESKLITTEQRRIIRIRLEYERANPGPLLESDYADDVRVQQEAKGRRGVESPGERRADMARESNRSRRKVPKSLRK